RQANFLSLAPRESHPPAPKWGQWTRHLHRQLNHKRLIKQEVNKHVQEPQPSAAYYVRLKET
ncbi:hypothetical protein CSV66_12780, partial [Sporosarcina sp. P30]